LGPFFAESRDFAFNLWRVFLQGSVTQNGVLELRPQSVPDYYARLQAFAHIINSQGIALLATVFVDNQDVGQDYGHFARVCEALRGTATLISGGNEWHKNGFDPGRLGDPGMLWSRGSDLGDAAPFRPYASFAEFHPRRDFPKSLDDSVASATFIRASGLTGPLLIDEPAKFGTNGSAPIYADPFTAYRFARHYSTECGGAVFHNWFGQRGLLMDGPTRECAAAWSRGMRL